MGRKPKYFLGPIDDDTELAAFFRTRQEEDNAFLNSPHIPTDAVRSVINKLLQYIHLRRLNREVANEQIMAGLLLTNRLVRQVKSVRPKRDDDPAILKRLLGQLGRRGIQRILDDCCRHSRGRMMAESDEVLRALNNAPFSASLSQRRRWIDANLPTILSSLKNKQRCFTECPSRTEWPPRCSDDRDLIHTPGAGNGPAAMKNAILAYFHGVETLTIRHYLEGRKLKTTSRPKKPRS